MRIGTGTSIADRAHHAGLATRESGEITYMTDGYTAHTCNGRDGRLTYVVFSPNSAGPHPVVFGMMGTGFGGSQECDAKTGKPLYRAMDPVMKEWAEAGFVAVNIGYHGVSNGLYGDLSYPGTE